MDDLHFKLQVDLDKIGDWLSANRLCGNALKSVSMLVGSKGRVKDLSLSLFLKLIIKNLNVCVQKTKYLGLWIDRLLTWED